MGGLNSTKSSVQSRNGASDNLGQLTVHIRLLRANLPLPSGVGGQAIEKPVTPSVDVRFDDER
jgi:hypothetical protein